MFYLYAKFCNLPDNVFVSSFYVFYIGDIGVPRGDKSRDNHRNSGSEIPARNGRTTQVGRTKNKCLMRVHKSWVTFHLLQFYEEIETSFEHDFLYSGNSFCLRKEDAKYRLKICREARKNICLKRLDGLEMFTSIHTKYILSSIFKSYAYFFTFHEKACQSRYTRMVDIDILLTCERSKYDKCSRFYIVINDRKFTSRCNFFHSNYIDRVVIVDSNICSEIFQKIHKIYYMWFNSRKMNPSTSRTENVSCDKILRCCNRKTCVEILFT